MVLIRKRRKARKTARRSTAARLRTNPRRKAKRRNPRFGLHRPSLRYGKKGWTRSSRSKLIKKGTRINPRRRLRVRRNPLNLKSLFARQNIMQMIAVAGGLTVGFLAIPIAVRVAPSLYQHRKFLGGANILLGLALAGFAKKSAIKTVGMTMASVGLYDLISQNIPALGLPMLADGSALIDKMIPQGTIAPPKTVDESAAADYLPVASDFMSSDMGVISEMTF